MIVIVPDYNLNDATFADVFA